MAAAMAVAMAVAIAEAAEMAEVAEMAEIAEIVGAEWEPVEAIELESFPASPC